LHEVQSRHDLRRVVEHDPIMGELVWRVSKFDFAENPELHLAIYTPEPGTATASKLESLLVLE
jgi:hypothetical protein